MTRQREIRGGRRHAWRTLAAIAVCLPGLSCALPAATPRAVDGRLDLSRWDFRSDGEVSLEGHWAICWGRLLEPGATCPEGWQPVRVSGLWSESRVAGPSGGQGVATYRLRIERPAGEPRLSLRAGSPSSAYRLWIDGVDRGGAGVVGATAAATTPGMRNHVYALPPSDSTQLWLQIANFEARSGGLRRFWLVGRPDAIQAWVGQELLRDALLFGVTLVAGIMALVSFALRPAARARGYFGLFSLVIALRSVAASPSDLGQLLAPWMSYAWMLRWEYLGTLLGLFAAIGYFPAKVEGVMPPRTMRLFQLVAAALVPVLLLAPLRWAFATLYLNIVLALVPLGLVLLCYGRAWRRGVAGVGTTLAASAIYLLAVVHDVLRFRGFDTTLELSPYFAVIWILVEISDQMKEFHRSFARAELLSDQLQEANFELRETESAVVRFVPMDFLRMLGKHSIREIEAGDHVHSLMGVAHVEIDAFASIVGRMSPEDLFGFMNELIGRLEPCIERRGGFVNHYRGDGLQVIFPSGADDAVAAAIEMHEAVREFNREGSELGRLEVDVGIGIDTGPLLLGTLGGDQHLSSGVLGEAVDTAPRIAALARSSATGLLITSRTRDCLSEPTSLQLRAIDTSLEVGSQPIALVEVLDALGERESHARRESPGSWSH